MGWRERDYARFTDEERRLLLGTGSGYESVGVGASGRRIGVNYAALLAVPVSGVLFAAGQFPRGHPLVPTLHVPLPGIGHGASSGSPRQKRVFRLAGPATARLGSTLMLHGSSSPSVSGPVTVSGSYGRG